MKVKFVIPLLIIVSIAAVFAWHSGLLADFYAEYPQREPLQTRQPWERIKVISHRGDGENAPENTLASFRSAIAKNMDFIEIDVRLTADGVPVVLHDATVDRTTDGVGEISGFSYAEVRELDAGSWFAPEFSGARIPTVEEVLEDTLGKACVYAHLKAVMNRKAVNIFRRYAELYEPGCLLIAITLPTNNAEMFDLDSKEAAVREKFLKVARLRQEEFEDQYLLFRRYWPEFPFVGIFRAGDDIDKLLAEYPGTVLVSVSSTKVTREMVEALHARGLWVYARVPLNQVDTQGEAAVVYARLIEAGIDIIFVEDPLGFDEFQNTYIAERKPD